MNTKAFSARESSVMLIQLSVGPHNIYQIFLHWLCYVCLPNLGAEGLRGAPVGFTSPKRSQLKVKQSSCLQGHTDKHGMINSF